MLPPIIHSSIPSKKGHARSLPPKHHTSSPRSPRRGGAWGDPPCGAHQLVHHLLHRSGGRHICGTGQEQRPRDLPREKIRCDFRSTSKLEPLPNGSKVREMAQRPGNGSNAKDFCLSQKTSGKLVLKVRAPLTAPTLPPPRSRKCQTDGPCTFADVPQACCLCGAGARRHRPRRGFCWHWPRRILPPGAPPDLRPRRRFGGPFHGAYHRHWRQVPILPSRSPSIRPRISGHQEGAERLCMFACLASKTDWRWRDWGFYSRGIGKAIALELGKRPVPLLEAPLFPPGAQFT